MVTVSGVGSNGAGFTVTTLPNISGISPSSGPVGTPITITGINFGTSQGTSAVTFNGIASTPSVWSPTQIVTPVPNGGTSGNLVVTVGGKSSNAVTFTVFGAAPTITRIHPSAAPVGTFVAIIGSGFGATQGSSKVTFNGTPVASIGFLNWSDTQIGVQVPGAATTGPVFVKLGGSGALSNGFIFQVTTNAGDVPGINALIEQDTYGFDVPGAVDLHTMQTGYNYSPFFDVGAYIGGVNYSSRYARLPSFWAGAVSNLGWGILPIWVGLQPGSTSKQSLRQYPLGDDGTASGLGDANTAVQTAVGLGIVNSIIYADIERFNASYGATTCTGGDQTVRNYVGSWVSTLHQNGFLAGVYFSAGNWCDINIPGGNAPDAIWVASGPYYAIGSAYSQNALNYAGKGPLYGLGPLGSSNPLPDTFLPFSRAHQFFSGVSTDPNNSAAQFPNGNCVLPPFSGDNSCNPYAVFNGVILNKDPNGTDHGIDWDFEYAPVVGWTGTSFLPAPNIIGPQGEILDPTVPVELDWEGVDAAFFSYHVVVSSDPGSLPFPGSGFSGCIGFCEIDESFIGDTSFAIDVGALDPTQTYYWTVSVNGVYKFGDWAPPGDFGFAFCDPVFGCGLF